MKQKSETQGPLLIGLIFGNKLETRMLRENEIFRKQDSTDLVDLYYFGSCFVPLSGCTKSTNSTNQFTSRTTSLRVWTAIWADWNDAWPAELYTETWRKHPSSFVFKLGSPVFKVSLRTTPTTEVIREVGTVPLEKLVVRPQPKELITRQI